MIDIVKSENKKIPNNWEYDINVRGISVKIVLKSELSQLYRKYT